jgi:Domain of unknown function (DUF4279)
MRSWSAGTLHCTDTPRSARRADFRTTLAQAVVTVTGMVDAPWKVKQYCYFWIASAVVTVAEVTEVLGIAPDRTTVMGSRQQSRRTVPPEHRWEIVCDTRTDR